MPGISIHVIDVSRGLPAQGLQVALYHCTDQRLPIASGSISAAGTLDDAVAARRLDPGLYEAEFLIGPWYRAQGVHLPQPAFLEVCAFRFGLADPDAHYHLPLKMTPWGYSLFRGGA